MRPGSSELEAARRVVSAAEREALEQAEALRNTAQALLESISNCNLDNIQSRVLGDFEVRLEDLREEMVETRRRAAVAEDQLQAARRQVTEIRSERDSVRASAEAELAQARAEAVHLLRAATEEAQTLLAATRVAIESNTAMAESVREQSEHNSMVATTLRAQLETALAGIRGEAERIRDSAEGEARQIVDDARRDAATSANDIRRQLADEVLALREIMERARDSFEAFAAAQAGSARSTQTQLATQDAP